MIRPFPKPRPFSNRLPRRKRVTIAAGFCCTDGIVLCADSQETIDDYLKVSAPKIEIRPEGTGKRREVFAVFVGAGHGPLVDRLVDEMWYAAENSKGNLNEAANAMAAANRDYYKELKTVFRDKDPDYPRAQIIYGVNVKNELALFKATGPIVNRIRNYEFAGVGVILAKYITGDRIGRIGRMTANQATILSLYILGQAERYVEGCGGQHQIVIMKPGKPPEHLDNWKQVAASAQMPFLDIQSKQLVLLTPDLELSDEDFEKKLHHLARGLRHSRLQQRKFAEMMANSLKTTESEFAEIDKEHPEPKG
jgi:hypothetical protein